METWTLNLPSEVFSFEVLAWIIPLVLVSIGIGVAIGRSYTLRNLNRKIIKERNQMLASLHEMTQSTEQLTTDVDNHNNELATVGRSVGDLETSGDFATVQRTLLSHIADVIESNKRLEDDLVLTRYRLDEQAQELDRTRREARTDALSGVANRKAFDEALQFMISHLKRHGTPFALLLSDVDHFKRINDTFGHQAGDHVVARLGDSFKQQVRSRDFVGRYGGDEFAILFAGIPPAKAVQVATRIRASIEATNFDVGGDAGKLAVTFSMGLACAYDSDTPESIFERADQALYKAKRSGRNRLIVASEDEAVADEEELVPAG